MRVVSMLALCAVACGGSQGSVEGPSPPPPGDSHVGSVVAPDAAAVTPVTPVTPTEPVPPPPPPGGMTILLKNAGDGDLNFGVTKGWAPVIFAYTGKPPKAKAVILFEAACTASCDSAPAAICPVCPEPKTKKEEQAMARIETAAAGKSLAVPWDGKVLAYEKATGGKPCKCWRKVEPAADTYTIKACGLRPPKEPGKASKPVCTEQQVTLGPGATVPQTLELSFK